MDLKLLSAKWQTLYSGLSVLDAAMQAKIHIM